METKCGYASNIEFLFRWKRMRQSIFVICLASLMMPYQALASTNTFSDVLKNQWYSAAIEWAYENEIIKGFPDGTFRPNVKVTEEQFITMIARVSKAVVSPYEDAEQRNMPLYYKLNLPLSRNDAAVYLAANTGFISENNNNIISESIFYLFENKISNGTINSNKSVIEQYQGDKFLTRAEAVTLLKRALDADLTFGAKLAEKPALNYPRSVIINPDAPEQFIKVISNLPTFSGLDIKESQFDHFYTVVSILEKQNEGIDSASFVLHTGRGEVMISVRYDNEITRNASREVISLYLGPVEAQELLVKYLEIKKQGIKDETYVFDSKSEYNVTYSSYRSIEISPK